jgi:GxxExxY protein
MEFDELSNRIIGSAIEVHRVLGPGLLESTYEQCLAHELSASGVRTRLQTDVPIDYKGVKLDCGFRADLIVEGKLLVELKSVEQLTLLHQAQLLTYMKLLKIPVGLLINFNTRVVRDGLKRLVL